MKWYRRIALTLSFLCCLSLTPAKAMPLDSVSATYQLLEKQMVQLNLSSEINREDFINQVAMNYSCFDTSKHHLKYYYYKNNPDELFIQVLPNDKIHQTADLTSEINRLASIAKTAGDPSSQIAWLNQYLVQHIHYDKTKYQDYLEGRPLNDLEAWTAAGALLKGNAVCEGYASAFMLLSDALGIPCMKISGTLNGIPHAWNSVYIPSLNEWRYVDVTNNDPEGLDVPENYLTHLLLVTDETLIRLGYQWNRSNEEALQDVRFPYLEMQALNELRRRGLIVGYGNGYYANNALLTREELASILFRLYQTPSNLQPDEVDNDISPWAKASVAFCKEHHLMIGFPDGKFHGKEPVSKQQLAVIMLRFIDDNDVQWDHAESRAVQLGIMSPGRSSLIHNTRASRSDVYDILLRSIHYKEH